MSNPESPISTTSSGRTAAISQARSRAAEISGTLDRPVRHHDLARLDRYGVTDDAARLIRTAWDLGNPDTHPDLAPLRLRRWAHMLGYRGHFSTKSRAYSTTLTAPAPRPPGIPPGPRPRPPPVRPDHCPRPGPLAVRRPGLHHRRIRTRRFDQQQRRQAWPMTRSCTASPTPCGSSA
ncbi:replication initiator [Nonomuraea indica]|uniref:replication initiator n=1 Tax=Nonomuraea indica TaxID=1581193 RepID=UPI003CCC3430